MLERIWPAKSDSIVGGGVNPLGDYFFRGSLYIKLSETESKTRVRMSDIQVSSKIV